MPRVLYGVSPIGLGHATRSMVVAESLRRSGAEVRIFSGGKAAEFLNSEGTPADDVVSDPVPHVSEGKMDRVALWYLRSWVALRRTIPRTERLASSFRPDVVVGDEEFSGLIVGAGSGTRRVMIADELELGFARSWLARKIEAKVAMWYSDLQESVDLLLVPEEGTDAGNRRYVGPIVRSQTLSPEETRRRYGIPPGMFVLVSLSGSGIGSYLVEMTRRALRPAGAGEARLVVTGNRGASFTGAGVIDLGVVGDNQNLVAAADVVVSTAGKSTIDEAAAAGTPIIAVPIRNHAEQERNAASLGYFPGDGERLAELVASKIGRREPPRRFQGGEKASQLILSML